MGQCRSQEVKSNRERQEPFDAITAYQTLCRVDSHTFLPDLLPVPAVTHHSPHNTSFSLLWAFTVSLSAWVSFLPFLSGKTYPYPLSKAQHKCDSLSELFATLHLTYLLHICTALRLRDHIPQSHTWVWNVGSIVFLVCDLTYVPAYSVFWSQMRHENVSTTY